MSSDENQSDENEGEGIKNLRKQYDTTKAERDALAERLAKLEAKERTTTVAEQLKAKGVPTGAAKFYTGEDVSEEAVSKWLEENADVFGASKQETAAGDPNAEAAQRVSDASFGAVDELPHGGGQQKVYGDPAEIERAIKTLPFDELVKRGYMPAPGTLFNPVR